MILFVDDEEKRMDSYRLILERELEPVCFFNNVDKAMDYFQKEISSIKLLILDIMMPPGDAFKDENTEEGLRTGLNFYDRVRSKTSNLPIIIFTNVTEENVEDHFKADPKCRFLKKSDVFIFELVEEAKKLLNPN
ncbi:MAG: response regulator [Blastocatellia bacterium]|nr:response regulator [Blastocatellia bacterium]